MNSLRKLFSESMLRTLAWASLISEILIVVTGGAVRLTASGLGCPTWPTCTPESLVTVPEMGIHGIIEFGNRLLTFVLLAVAIAFLISAWKARGSRKVLATAIWLIAGIFLQAVVGGISVLMKLNPWVVGLHFVISAVMISISSLQIWRVYEPKVSKSSSMERFTSNLLALFGTAAILIGIVVTGSGPHAGDFEAPRNGLDSELWQHFHSYPAYLALAITFVQLLVVRKRDVDGYASRLTFWTLVVLVVQAIVGVAQARLGLPIWMVLLHIALAATTASLLTLQWLSVRKND
ncbi:MAG: COX15/CtaA family protein [Micrococcales bacterium]